MIFHSAHIEVCTPQHWKPPSQTPRITVITTLASCHEGSGFETVSKRILGSEKAKCSSTCVASSGYLLEIKNTVSENPFILVPLIFGTLGVGLVRLPAAENINILYVGHFLGCSFTLQLWKHYWSRGFHRSWFPNQVSLKHTAQGMASCCPRYCNSSGEWQTGISKSIVLLNLFLLRRGRENLLCDSSTVGSPNPRVTKEAHWRQAREGRFNTQQVSNGHLFLQKTTKKTPNNSSHLQARCPSWIRINSHTENVCSDWKNSQNCSLQIPGEGNLRLPPFPTHCPPYGAALTNPGPSTHTPSQETQHNFPELTANKVL